MTLDAIEFIEQNKINPFFCTMQHGSFTRQFIRVVNHFEKYCEKLGVDFPTDPNGWPLNGQKNPYYCAMIEMFDHYVGQLISHLPKPMILDGRDIS